MIQKFLLLFLLTTAMADPLMAEETVKEGVYREYYEDGPLLSEENYKAGEKDGVQRYYYSDGILQSEKFYKNNLTDGLQKYYDEEGRLELEFEEKNGKMEGSFKRYKDDGQIWETRVYSAGQRLNEDGEPLEGGYELKYDNGQMYLEEHYVAGFIQGVAKRYHPNGQLNEEREYKDGQLQGLFKRYNQNGKLFSETFMNGDVPQGLVRIYYEDGRVSQEGNFLDGKYEGAFKAFYPHGGIKMIQNFKQGVGDEPLYFYRDGTVKAKTALNYPQDNPFLFGLICYIVFVFSLTFHEAAHALSALKMGDSTAYEGGQVTLNPTPHMRREPLGTIVVPILSYILNGWMIGWASAPYNVAWALTYPKRSALMSLAGPAANFILIIVSTIFLMLGFTVGIFDLPSYVGFSHLAESTLGGVWPLVVTFLSVLFSLNLILFIFNMLPLPPLDGSGVVPLILPHPIAQKYMLIINHSAWALLGLFFAWKLMDVILGPLFSLAIGLLYVWL